MQPIIRTENLTHTYSYGTPFERTAINGVDFYAEKREFIGIIGHTGSGKSTFVQHLNGLIAPASGRVLLDGEDIHESKAKTVDARYKVGLVFQYPEYQLFEDTVYKDIAFGPRNMKLTEPEIDERVREAAGFVGIDPDVLEKSPFELSGGQKRRVAIAGVIAMRPEVLILDEPTAGLDPRGKESIIANIRDYHRKTECTVIMVTHSMEDIAKIADRIVVFNAGSIIMEGTAGEIFGRGSDLQEIGLDVPVVTQVVMKLREMGLPVSGSVFTVEQARDAILKLAGGTRRA